MGLRRYRHELRAVSSRLAERLLDTAQSHETIAENPIDG
jgi:hypothetical protein